MRWRWSFRRPSRSDYIEPIKEMINRLCHLTPLDRSEGWQERTSEFLIERLKRR